MISIGNRFKQIRNVNNKIKLPGRNLNNNLKFPNKNWTENTPLELKNLNIVVNEINLDPLTIFNIIKYASNIKPDIINIYESILMDQVIDGEIIRKATEEINFYRVKYMIENNKNVSLLKKNELMSL